ncbi:D-aminoacylase [soil metagenome]
MFDVLIEGGLVIDGTGAPRLRADVGVSGGRIAVVGTLDGERARRTIDAAGLHVCPGFVDMHAHSDLQLLADPSWDVKLAQGVTLEVIGQDGLGLAPITRETGAELRERLVAWNGDPPGIAWDWRGVGAYLDRFDRAVSPNVAMLVPHGTVRLLAMGDDRRSPTDRELASMRALVQRGMREGAVGLSTGLTYAPAMFAEDDELVELCRVVAPFGGYYAPHQRSYGRGALEAYAASIEIGRRAGVPVHLTHASLGFEVNRGKAPQLLGLVDAARAEGVDVTLDSYPYVASSTYLHAYLPSWAHEGGTEALLGRLADLALRERMRREVEESGSDGAHGVPVNWRRVVISSVRGDERRHLVGMSVAEAAAGTAGTPAPFDFYCDLLIAERLGVGSLGFFGNEENVRLTLRHPAHMAGSDGIVAGDRPHPRAWGTFARYLGLYVRELGLITLEEMVRKMTSLPARRLGFPDRGLLRTGAAADVVCFDAGRVRDTATYEDPRRAPEGIAFVLVNGVVVMEGGNHTGARPGRALRRGRRAVDAAPVLGVIA